MTECDSYPQIEKTGIGLSTGCQPAADCQSAMHLFLRIPPSTRTLTCDHLPFSTVAPLAFRRPADLSHLAPAWQPSSRSRLPGGHQPGTGLCRHGPPARYRLHRPAAPRRPEVGMVVEALRYHEETLQHYSTVRRD